MNNIKDIFNLENRTKYFTHLITFLFLATVMIFGLLLANNNDIQKNKAEAVGQSPDPFAELYLEAKSVIVWDIVNQKEIFAKNPDVPLPLASLTKVMTAVTTSQLPEDLQIKIASEYLEPEGDSALVVGDTWTAGDLRDFTLLTSSNDGAFALAAVTKAGTAQDKEDERLQFVKAMNDKAKEIGLVNSHFFNEHGLDRTLEKGGAYGTARDMALLFEYALQNHPNLLEATRYPYLHFTSAEKTYDAKNTNIFVNKIPNLLASKTGFTDLAGGNLVIAYDAGLNQPIIIAILGSSEGGRFQDTLQLVEASMKYINQNN